MICAVALLSGCGARSGLEVDDARGLDGGLDAAAPLADTGPPPLDVGVPLDAGVDVGVPLDAGPPDPPDTGPPPDAWMPDCIADSDCDDGVSCTDDRCDTGGCAHTPSDAYCQDRFFCNGEERCDPTFDCVGGANPCDDGVGCTADSCDDSARRCSVTPIDDLCAPSRDCDVVGGCLPRAVVNVRGQLYDLELPSGRTTAGPDVGRLLTDIALREDGTLYGASNSQLYVIDYAAGTATVIGSSGGSALEFGPDGELYGSSGGSVYVLDVVTGGLTGVATLGTMDEPMYASGDIAFLGERMLVTAVAFGGRTDWLVEVDLATGTSHVVGNTGEHCVYGLAEYEGRLYGMTCNGRLLEIDPDAGTSEYLGPIVDRIYGASVR